MTETKGRMPQTSDKGGEIDSRWGSEIPERDQDQSWDRTRHALRSGELPRTRRSKRPVVSQTDQPPGNPASIKPWNENMVRPINAQGHYREIDPTTGNVIKPPKPR